MKKKVSALIIMDGFGCGADDSVSAVARAGTPNIDALKSRFPNTLINASGMAVGLPEGQMGNSEVGHLNIGAGRIVYQELTRISKSIADGDFFEKQELLTAIDNCRGAKLHLMGLVSDGGVHSHLDHLLALIRLAKDKGLDNVYIHCFLDGRDVPPTSAAGYLEALQRYLDEHQFGEIATISGRYYAMDRDNRWERVSKAYAALFYGEGERCGDGIAAVKESYKQGVNDEFVLPIVVTKGEEPVAVISPGDSVVFFNFRPDRARELTRAITHPEFDGFQRREYVKTTYVCMTQYDKSFENVMVAYKPETLKNTLGEYLSASNMTQLRIAETEKYAHVTFFFNGGVEAPNNLEDRKLIPSPKVATYDLQPEMSAYEVTEEAVALVKSGKYDVIILNLANADMVGHTGVMEAAEKAVRVVDECVGRLADTILDCRGRGIVTADHGNADRMIDTDGSPFTAHTTNPVPFIICDPALQGVTLREDGRLCDAVPTLLDMMGLKKPPEMTGESIIKVL